MISEVAKKLSSEKHIERSYKTGVSGEAYFIDMCKKHNIPYRQSTKEENINDHIDFYIWNKKVDVKGLKKSHKEGYIVIEFINVKGEAGWCSEKSKIDYVAFQMPNCFVILDKSEILKYCRKHVKNEYVKEFKDCYKKLYTRKERKDIMTKLHLDDIEKMEFAIVLK